MAMRAMSDAHPAHCNIASGHAPKEGASRRLKLLGAMRLVDPMVRWRLNHGQQEGIGVQRPRENARPRHHELALVEGHEALWRADRPLHHCIHLH